MKNLTQEQAERCARACGWVVKPIKRLSDSSPAPSWVDAKGEFKQSTVMILDPDPYYWFPRLWDRLIEKNESGGWFKVNQDSPNKLNIAWISVSLNQREPFDKPDARSGHPCLAFCEAIEAREGK